MRHPTLAVGLLFSSFVACSARGTTTGDGFNAPDAGAPPADAAVPAMTMSNVSYLPATAGGVEMEGLFKEVSFHLDNTLTQRVHEITALVVKTSTFEGEGTWFEAPCAFSSLVPDQGAGALVTLTSSYRGLVRAGKCDGHYPDMKTYDYDYGFAFPGPTTGLGTESPATGAITLTLKLLLEDGSRIEVTGKSP